MGELLKKIRYAPQTAGRQRRWLWGHQDFHILKLELNGAKVMPMTGGGRVGGCWAVIQVPPPTPTWRLSHSRLLPLVTSLPPPSGLSADGAGWGARSTHGRSESM